MTELKKRLQVQLAINLSESRNRSMLNAFVSKIDFDRVLLNSAQRKALGAPPKHHDLYADETPEAVWAWELTQSSLYIEPMGLLKETLAVRENVQSQASLIQALQKL